MKYMPLAVSHHRLSAGKAKSKESHVRGDVCRNTRPNPVPGQFFGSQAVFWSALELIPGQLTSLVQGVREIAFFRAACGKVALKELQRLCQMAHAPPSGGQWRAWYARLCRLVRRYELRPDDAGRLVRRLRREMGSLWVFRGESGVVA